MEAQTVVKAGLIFLAALVITLLVLWLQPRREMNTGGCGPRALLAVASHYGNTETETDALALFPNHGFEVSLTDLQAAAPRLGLDAQARRMSLTELRAKRPLGVLHIDDVHFVALVGYDGDTALIVDPLYRGETRPVRWLLGDLKTRWDGAILVVTPRARK